MKLDPVLMEILVCPDCKGTLTADAEHDELICDECGLTYPVRDDIPVMLVDEARQPGSPRLPSGETATADVSGADDATFGDEPVRPIDVPPADGSPKEGGLAQGSDG